MKRTKIKSVIKFILIVLFVLFLIDCIVFEIQNVSILASTMVYSYDLENYTFQINNIADDVEEIRLMEYREVFIKNDDKDYRFKTEKVPLFTSEKVSFKEKYYPIIKEDNTIDYLLKPILVSTKYAYQYGSTHEDFDKTSFYYMEDTLTRNKHTY